MKRAAVCIGVLPRAADGRGGDCDINGGAVVWADIDKVSIDEAKSRIAMSGLPSPCILINSGHGAHAYWKLSESCDSNKARQLVRGVAVVLGADTKACNPSRIMRLPGTINWGDGSKAKPVARSEIVLVDSDAQPLPLTLIDNVIKTKQRVGDAWTWIQKQSQANEGNRNNIAFNLSTTLAQKFGIAEDEIAVMLSWWNARNDTPLSDDELLQIVSNAYKKRGSKASVIRLERMTCGLQIRGGMQYRHRSTRVTHHRVTNFL